jgi:hypothetical protein
VREREGPGGCDGPGSGLGGSEGTERVWRVWRAGLMGLKQSRGKRQKGDDVRSWSSSQQQQPAAAAAAAAAEPGGCWHAIDAMRGEGSAARAPRHQGPRPRQTDQTRCCLCLLASLSHALQSAPISRAAATRALVPLLAGDASMTEHDGA